MMRSLFSGVAGLRTHQTKMDVIGNNIANVNTIGFKSSSVLFRDILYQTTSNATGATATTGGTNASQIGLGTKVSSISTSITSNGSAQSTGNPYDLMINGPSFFIVSRDGVNYFTKVGAFDTDGAGCLTTSNGYQVMGWTVDSTAVPPAIKRGPVQPLYPESEENKVSAPEQTSKAYMKGNVDLTDKDLTSQDGAAISVSVYDALGYGYNLKFNLKQDEGVEDKSLYTLTLENVLDSDDNIISSEEGGYTATIGGASSIKIKFNAANGTFDYVGQAGQSEALISITPRAGSGKAEVFKSTINGEQVEGITVNFKELTMFEADGNSDAKMIRGGLDTTGGGRTFGTQDDITIDNSGKIFGIYSNGETKLLGQIAVASFRNPMAMEQIGDSLYKTTQNSGDFDGVGSAIDDDGGSMAQGVLEMSNVDLSVEFTDMITTQRGFQANSRIITTSDSMLEELVNLKR